MLTFGTNSIFCAAPRPPRSQPTQLRLMRTSNLSSNSHLSFSTAARSCHCNVLMCQYNMFEVASSSLLLWVAALASSV